MKNEVMFFPDIIGDTSISCINEEKKGTLEQKDLHIFVAANVFPSES